MDSATRTPAKRVGRLWRRLAGELGEADQRGSESVAAPRERSRVARGLVAAWRCPWLGPYRAAGLVLLATLMTFSLLRIVMLVSYAERSALDAATIVEVLWVGFRFDLLVGLCLVLLQVVHITVVPASRRLGPVSRGLFEFEWLFGALLLPLLCVVEWLFFDEFQSRLNYIAFEYLVYPSEVCCNIWQSYAMVPILSGVVTAGGMLYLFSRRRLLALLDAPLSAGRRFGLLTVVVAAIVGLWLTTGMASCNVSPDRVTGECAGNGVYSFVYYALTCRFDYDENYVTTNESDAIRRLRRQVVGEGDRLIEPSRNPVDRIVASGRPRRAWNVVLILEESFGSNFVGVQGDDRALTPHFDALTRRGVLFDNFYATGNRTARALEAVMSSMPPLPTESILKRDHSDHVFTLANVLAKRGYERLFVTGGRGLFDGVRSFMTQNGFNRFIELSDFRHPVFTNAWGVSDEDLFRRSLSELDKLHAGGKPFFATLLTVSNHRPYTFPEGRISNAKQTRKSAVRYADWALGYFFREAKAHEFYKNTLFVVMGDHGARIYGSQLFPLQSYRVPVLMILPEGEGRGTRCGTLGCSLDVAPTILGRLGGEYRSVFFGRDVLTTAPGAGRAIMQHNHDVALLDAQHHLVNLGYGKTVWNFDVDPKDFQLKAASREGDEGSVRDAASLFQTAFELYYGDRWFPDAPPATADSGDTSVHNP